MENIIYLSIVEIFGDFELKKFARSGSLQHLGQGLIGYAGVIYFLIRSLRLNSVIYVNGMWDGFSGLLETIAAYLILGERLEHTYQYLGIVLISCGIFLLHSGGNK